MKVLPTLDCGGTENQVTTLSRALADDGFDLEVACMRRVGPLVNAITERDVPLREYPISSFWNPRSIGQQVRLARHLVGRRMHIVHTYSFYGNVFAIPPAAAVGIPVIIASVRDRGVYLTPRQIARRNTSVTWPTAFSSTPRQSRNGSSNRDTPSTRSSSFATAST